MSDTPTETEVEAVLDAAQGYINVQDHQAAYDLLEPLHEGNVVSGEELGRTSFLLGEACLGLDGLDAAMYYFEEATQTATGDTQQRAQSRVEEIRRRDDAIDAEHEGVDGEQEAEAVLRAAEDALANNDHSTAWQYFSQAYDGIQMTNPQISRASVGMAQCHLNAGETQEAEGYLQVAEGADASALTDRIAGLREQIRQIDAGETAAEGGVERSELDELQAAGMAAARSGDWESAFRYFEQIYESSDVQGTQRGRAVMNMAICCLHTHDYDAAHQYFTEASSTARPERAALAAELLEQLSQLDDAADIVARIDVDRDMGDD
jgi:thioredoxin-like negative regulator of GroEL